MRNWNLTSKNEFPLYKIKVKNLSGNLSTGIKANIRKIERQLNPFFKNLFLHSLWRKSIFPQTILYSKLDFLKSSCFKNQFLGIENSHCFSGMRTARNIFIATLAVADSTLCLFTMPMTLMGILLKYWPFGTNSWILCKISRTSPAVTVFFSSYTMALIAVDRHRFIVHNTKRQVWFQWLSTVFTQRIWIWCHFLIVFGAQTRYSRRFLFIK